MPDYFDIGVPVIKAQEDAGPVPVGSVITISKDQIQVDGWLVCNGSEFNPEKYPALVAVFWMTPRRTIVDRLLRRSRKPTMAFGLNRVPNLTGRIL